VHGDRLADKAADLGHHNIPSPLDWRADIGRNIIADIHHQIFAKQLPPGIPLLGIHQAAIARLELFNPDANQQFTIVHHCNLVVSGYFDWTVCLGQSVLAVLVSCAAPWR